MLRELPAPFRAQCPVIRVDQNYDCYSQRIGLAQGVKSMQSRNRGTACVDRRDTAKESARFKQRRECGSMLCLRICKARSDRTAIFGRTADDSKQQLRAAMDAFCRQQNRQNLNTQPLARAGSSPLSSYASCDERDSGIPAGCFRYCFYLPSLDANALNLETPPLPHTPVRPLPHPLQASRTPASKITLLQRAPSARGETMQFLQKRKGGVMK